jgi:hypothetical protein
MYIIFSLLLLCANGLTTCEPPKNPMDEVSQNQPVKKRIEGDIFIVPNSLWTIGTNDPSDKCARMHKLFKLEPKLGNHCVEIWTANRDAKDASDTEVIREKYDRGISANWTDHGHPVLGRSFPDVLPESLLDGKNENDVIEFDYTNKQTNEVFRVALTCAQLKHRYWRHYGKPLGFHEVLERLKR